MRYTGIPICIAKINCLLNLKSYETNHLYHHIRIIGLADISSNALTRRVAFDGFSKSFVLLNFSFIDHE